MARFLLELAAGRGVTRRRLPPAVEAVMGIARKLQVLRAVAATSHPRETRLDATDWWALSLGIAACAVALLIFAADADGAAAAAVLVAASVLIAAALQIKALRKVAD
jgi:hypothetical protein